LSGEYMTLRQIADRFGVHRSVARRWLLKEGYEFEEVRDRDHGNQMVAALPWDIAADALHRRNDQGFAVVGVKREKGAIWTEAERQARAVLRDVEQMEVRRRAIEDGRWVDEVSGFIMETRDPAAFAEAADCVADLKQLVRGMLDHSEGHGNAFELINLLHAMVDDHGELSMDASNMVSLALTDLERRWREQAVNYRGGGGKEVGEKL
jgi:hypothetical protein